jgi:hypothetical protein
MATLTWKTMLSDDAAGAVAHAVGNIGREAGKAE